MGAQFTLAHLHQSARLPNAFVDAIIRQQPTIFQSDGTMIRATVNYFRSIPAVVIDGLTFVLIQMLTFLAAAFGGDEAAKYVAPAILFWLKLLVGELACGFLALKMFRSTAYGDHL